METDGLRWRLTGAPGELFPDVAPPRRELREVEYLHVRARRIINRVPEASRLPFRYTINAYRGCTHACTYCFARPTHEYLGMGIGEDFERRIVVKVNAAERLRAELAAPSWSGETIAMGTNTDPYQQCEGRYRLTRRIIETLSAARNPFSILTKSTMILRDTDLLAAAAERTWVHTALSIGTLDDDVWRLTEPGTPPPRRRLDAVARLNEAGIGCDVLMAPVLPGFSDSPEQLRATAAACLDAGARSVTPIVLHLRRGVRDHYLGWLAEARPDLLDRYEELYPRAYAPGDVQRRVAETVRAVVEERGPARRNPRAAREGGPPSPPPVAEAPPQLRLLP